MPYHHGIEVAHTQEHRAEKSQHFKIERMALFTKFYISTLTPCNQYLKCKKISNNLEEWVFAPTVNILGRLIV